MTKIQPVLKEQQESRFGVYKNLQEQEVGTMDYRLQDAGYQLQNTYYGLGTSYSQA